MIFRKIDVIGVVGVFVGYFRKEIFPVFVLSNTARCGEQATTGSCIQHAIHLFAILRKRA